MLHTPASPHRSLARLSLVLALALGPLAGCTADLDGLHGADEVDNLGELTQDVILCPPWDCGGNTAMLHAFYLQDLHLGGLLNNDGFRLLYLQRPGGQQFQLDVQNGNFYATDSLNVTRLVDASFVGSKIVLWRAGVSYDVYIREYTRSVEYWRRPGHFTSAYRLGYYLPGKTYLTDLCKDPPADPVWDGMETYALLVKGERYHGPTKTVSATGSAATQWFNIACAGSALAKMKLLDYDPELPAVNPLFTTWQQRQATIKMITADYCGTGHSFTVAGEPLRWTHKGGYSNYASETSHEALWTKDGALCLDVPRYASTEPNILVDQILPECPELPACSSMVEVHGQLLPYNQWPMFAEWRTANPN